VWEAGRGWTVAWGLLLVVQGLLPVAVVYLTRSVVDAMVDATGSGGSWEEVRPAVFLVLAMAGVLLVSEVARAVGAYLRAVQGELVRDHIAAMIHERSLAVDMTFYETPEYHDHLHRAQTEAATRPLAVLENVGTLLQNLLTLVAMLGVLLPYGAWLPGALLVSTLPALYVVARSGAWQYEWRRRNTERERRAWYYDYLLTRAEPAAEVRLLSQRAR